MKPETIEEQTIYLYKHLAEQIEFGIGDIEDFTDGRGGFISPIVFVESFINRDLSGKNAEIANNLVSECKLLLTKVQECGWSNEQKQSAEKLILKLKKQKWVVE